MIYWLDNSHSDDGWGILHAIHRLQKSKTVLVNLLNKNHITSKISPSILRLFKSLKRSLCELQPVLLLSTPQVLVSFRNQWKENEKHQSWAWPKQGDPKHVYRISSVAILLFTHSLNRLYPGWMLFPVRDCGGWFHVSMWLAEGMLRQLGTCGLWVCLWWSFWRDEHWAPWTK